MGNRRLVITCGPLGFITETQWSRNGIDWSNLSHTFTEAFPFHIVARIAARMDYRILVRCK